MRWLLLVVGSVCCLSGQGVELADLTECSGIDDESTRLACFEQLVRELAVSQPETADTKAEDKTGNETQVTAGSRESETDEVVSRDDEGSRVISQPVEGVEDSFGLLQGPESTGINAVIKHVRKSKTRRNIHILTLMNGQVWRETQFGKGTIYRSGDRVLIQSGRMGSFVLTNLRTGFNCHVRRMD